MFPEYRKKDKENKSEDVIDYKGTYYNFRNITGSESITLALNIKFSRIYKNAKSLTKYGAVRCEETSEIFAEIFLPARLLPVSQS